MDIICATCGKHFQNIESVREHARSHIDQPKPKVNKSNETSDILKAELPECPFCHKTSLWRNPQTLIFECLNWGCRHLITKNELEKLSQSFHEEKNTTGKQQSTTEHIVDEIDEVLFTKMSEQLGDNLNCPVHPEICSRCKKNRDSCGYKDKSESSFYCHFYSEI
jgi:Zn ribbon nucleic-acid-binding protein